MKYGLFLLWVLLISSLALGQTTPSNQQSPSETQPGSAPAPEHGAQTGQRAQHREQMQAMCKEHMDAMKTEVQKMHSNLDQMKANVAKISNADEKARWQANVDMWQIVADHHDQMLKHMEDAQANGMGCGMMMGDMGMGGGMMRHHGIGPMGAPPNGPPPTKPQ